MSLRSEVINKEVVSYLLVDIDKIDLDNVCKIISESLWEDSDIKLTDDEKKYLKDTCDGIIASLLNVLNNWK